MWPRPSQMKTTRILARILIGFSCLASSARAGWPVPSPEILPLSMMGTGYQINTYTGVASTYNWCVGCSHSSRRFQNVDLYFTIILPQIKQGNQAT